MSLICYCAEEKMKAGTFLTQVRFLGNVDDLETGNLDR